MKTPKEILSDLVNYEVKKALGYLPQDYADKNIDQATSAILALFRVGEEEIEKILSEYIFDESDGKHLVKAGLAHAIANLVNRKE